MSDNEQMPNRDRDHLIDLDSHLHDLGSNANSDFLPPPFPVPDKCPTDSMQSEDSKNHDHQADIDELPFEELKSFATQQNQSASRLERDDVSPCDQRSALNPSTLIDSDSRTLGIGHLGSGNDHGSGNMESEVFVTSAPPGDVDLKPSEPHSVTAGDLWRSLLWLVTLVLMFLSAISFGPMLVEKYQYAAARGRMQAQYESATDMLSRVSFKDSTLASELVVHKISPSVVSVRATSHSNIAKYQIEGTGQGSGVILSTDGFIITNNHVVEGADQIEVTLADRREYTGKVVGRDRETDLAVIRIEADNLIAAEWGNSNELELGSAVWAMGSPFGLDQTVTRGIISGKHRRTADTLGNPNPHQDLLQTDAAINPGNSGGPLVNSRGEVIGINTSIYGESFQGISFAVPSSLAKEIVGKLIEKGTVTRGFLGVIPIDVTYSDALRLRLPRVAGVLVTLVEPASPAATAGLRRNDVILELNGQPIENQTLLFRHIGMTDPGSVVEVKFVRNGVVQSTTTEISRVPFRRNY